MVLSEEPKACSACAKAKRKCGRQIPICQRCRERGMGCYYPPQRPTNFVRLEEPIASSEAQALDEGDSGLLRSSSSMFIDNFEDMPSSIALGLMLPSYNPFESVCSANWFLSPETWKIDNSLVPTPVPVSMTGLKGFVNVVQLWFETWAKTGSNPFIHSFLYRYRFPNYLQVAFTSLLSYINKTEENTDMILRIVENQAAELLQDNGVDKNNPDLKSIDTIFNNLDTFEQLARVHTLLVYQMIGLFDGDIRSRHLAEKRNDILRVWSMQMLQCASINLSMSSAIQDPLDMTPISASDNSKHLWHSWIVAESVRRTWLISIGIISVYYVIQKGYVECSGSVRFTYNQGLWDARSAYAWEKVCSEKEIGLIKRFEAERFFREASPADVDEFSRLMLELSFGTEGLKS